ncbi:DUF7007 domain-containing protein [Pseudactinotalea terrae]|uniref:DUF7007 domain-containing protein n=1 Tax=Pseudactinotalea terrae TaxID=1743262 RepID=UPI0012E305CA|nr:hypothetical protein [Pseudactinotalea terrae]
MTSIANRKRQPAGIITGGQFATETRAESNVTLAPAQQDWGSAGIRIGSRTPWGAADVVYDIADGIAEVGTPSHGGIKLSPQRNKLVPAPLRNASGWYEEDCEANIPMWTFPAEYAAHRQGRDRSGEDRWADPDFVRRDAAERTREWFPDQWEKATGETVTAEQSRARAEQLFHTEHAADHVAVSASYSKDHPGMVEVTTTIGGRRPGIEQEWEDMGQRKFLVPKAEYDTRDRMPFVIDPARHTDITAPPAPPKPPAVRVHSARVDRTGLTSAQKARVDKDLGTRYRLADGSVKTLADVIETDGVTGKGAWVDEAGRTHYSLQQKKHADSSSYSSLPVSKATFGALVDVPDVRTETDLAREEFDRALAAREKANNDYRFNSSSFEQRRKASAARDKAEARLTAANARLRELMA